MRDATSAANLSDDVANSKTALLTVQSAGRGYIARKQSRPAVATASASEAPRRLAPKRRSGRVLLTTALLVSGTAFGLSMATHHLAPTATVPTLSSISTSIASSTAMLLDTPAVASLKALAPAATLPSPPASAEILEALVRGYVASRAATAYLASAAAATASSVMEATAEATAEAVARLPEVQTPVLSELRASLIAAVASAAPPAKPAPPPPTPKGLKGLLIRLWRAVRGRFTKRRSMTNKSKA